MVVGNGFEPPSRRLSISRSTKLSYRNHYVDASVCVYVRINVQGCYRVIAKYSNLARLMRDTALAVVFRYQYRESY